MKSASHNVRVAIAFLTRIPVVHGEVTSMGAVTTWFPTVGIIVGVLCGAVWAAASSLVSPLSASALAITSAVLVTGAFHHDGLADSMDGLVGGWTPAQRREILKDSRHGTYGVMALVLQMVLQISLLADLPIKSGVVALVVAHCVGRTSAVWVMKSGSGLNEGLGSSYVADVRWTNIVAATITSFVVLGALLGPFAVAVIAGVALAIFPFAGWAIKKIGGIVGDILGATEQVGETAALLVLVILHRQAVSIPWW